ncbi:2-oxo-3-deoxygalactonate kinase [Sphingomonas sp. DBB INV C78]|uniref:2-dehydro-3-deoxygalactonokinase n=1 Tax=Sphingomonas sp. DBB INV C78 TaxID=3349434 RepID=UPI0036D23B93
MPAFLAIDWGTTHRRAYRIEGGTVAAAVGDGRGAKFLSRPDYPAELATIRDQLGDLPALLVGMVGSSLGWQEVPYLALPADIGDLGRNLHPVEHRTAIVPGLMVDQDKRFDVMRGEEVQILGSIASGDLPPDALVCQPGTHCKWVRVREGKISDFTTAMTGEMFALLKTQSLLAPQLVEQPLDDGAFCEGVLAGAGGDLLGALFGVRAAAVLGKRDRQASASYASGLLIGSDVAARFVSGQIVYLIADAELGSLYARAIGLLGGDPRHIDSQTAFVAGATAIQEMSS